MLLIESPSIYQRMLLLAEIPSIWNWASHFIVTSLFIDVSLETSVYAAPIHEYPSSCQ